MAGGRISWISSASTLRGLAPSRRAKSNQLCCLKPRLGAPSIPMGPFWAFGSAAYWVIACRRQAIVASGELSVGANLLEETAACILGGYGISAEVGGAAFRALKSSGLLPAGRR